MSDLFIDCRMTMLIIIIIVVIIITSCVIMLSCCFSCVDVDSGVANTIGSCLCLCAMHAIQFECRLLTQLTRLLICPKTFYLFIYSFMAFSIVLAGVLVL